MKPRTEDERESDFEKITKLAKLQPIVNCMMKVAPEEMKKLIMGGLSYLLLVEEKDTYNRLLYLCRLAKGSEYDISAGDIYKLGLEFEMTDLYKFDKVAEDYKYTFLVEAFILANLSGELSDEILSFIIDLAGIMECDKEEIQVLGMVAKSQLVGDLDCMQGMPTPIKHRWSGKLKEYINSEWIQKQRQCCGQLCVSKYRIKKSLPPDSIVKKGDIICTYVEKDSEIVYTFSSALANALGAMRKERGNAPDNQKPLEKIIVAPCDGIVYYITDMRAGEVKEKMDEYKIVYVVSYFDDHSDLVKWYNVHVKPYSNLR